MLPESLDLPSPGAIHLWQIAVSAAPVDILYDVLDSAERVKADKFVFDRDRIQCIVARGTLRHLLARYMKRTPEAITFSYGPAGKPELSSSFDSALRFNVSHSGDIVLLAFATGQNVGVDVERIRESPDFDELARSHFSPREQLWLYKAGPGEVVPRFFQLWAAKEAYIKMAGGGLSIPLQDFTIVDASEVDKIIPVDRETAILPPAFVRNAPVPSGYAAAVAAEDGLWNLLPRVLA